MKNLLVTLEINLIGKNMKKAAIFFIMAICAVFASCEKETILIAEPSTVSFTDAGGTQSITITANKAWSARADQSWCQVSPSAGEDDAGTRISISCDANTSYDARSCTITISCAEMTKTISVSQATNNGLLVSQTEYNLSNSAQKLNIEVKANVAFDVIVDDACKGWIKHTATKGLSNSTVELDIAANDTYDGREGKVTIRQKDGSLQTNITIKQGQTNGLFITTSEYNLSNEKHTLTVEVLSNIEFDVKPEVSWIRYVETKGLKTSQIVLDIEANADYDAREGKVNVKQKNGDLSGTITIKQEQKYGLFVSESVLNISNEAQTIDVEVKYNVEYAVVIPEADKSWITEVNTKGLTSRHHSFHINKNETLDNRTASITFKQKDGPLSGTVTINQAQTDSISLDKTEFDLTYEKQTFDVEVKSNVAYQIDIPSSLRTWLRRVDTKSVTTDKVTFEVDENATEDERSGIIKIKQVDGSIEKSISVVQWQKGILVIEGMRDTVLNSTPCSFDFTIKTNQEYQIEIEGGDWLQIVNSKAIPEYTKTIAVSENKTTEFRKATINIKTTDGEFSKSFEIKQRANARKYAIFYYKTNYADQRIAVFGHYDSWGFDMSSIEKVYIDDVEVEPQYDYNIKNSGEHQVWVLFKNLAIPGGSTDHTATNLYKVIIGDDITYIGSNCYNGLHNLTYLYIGENVKHIENCLVGYSHPDLVIEVSPKNKYYDSRDNCSAVIETSTGTLIAGSAKTVIPSGVKTIARQAFWQTRGMGVFTIPSHVQGVESESFMNATISKLIIESPSTRIEEGAFYWNTELAYIEADNNNISLDHRCYHKDGTLLIFAGKDITEYTVPSYIKRIGHYVFSDTRGITTITLPDGLKSIGFHSFAGCSINSITIPDSVEMLGSQTFMGNTELTYCILGKGLKDIGYYTFQNCPKLSEIYCLADPALSISGDKPFQGVAENGTLYVPKGTDYSSWLSNEYGYLGYCNWKISEISTTIESISLDNNSLQLREGDSLQLHAIIIPRNLNVSVTWSSTNSNIATVSTDGVVKGIKEGECEIIASSQGISASCKVRVINIDPNLADVKGTILVQSATSKTKLFYDNGSTLNTISKILVDGEPVDIEASHRFSSVGYHTVEFFFKDNCIPGQIFWTSSLTGEVEISDNVLSIGYDAFVGSNQIEVFKIGKRVSTLGETPFRDCLSLSDIIVDKDNMFYDSRDNCHALVESSTNTLVQGTVSTIIPNSIRTIGKSAFSSISKLVSIDIPASVTVIDNNAFAWSGIEEVSFAPGLTSIGYGVFSGCNNLRLFKGTHPGIIAEGRGLSISNELVAVALAGLDQFVIPEGITSIAESLFSGNSTLITVKLPSTLKTIGSSAFMSSKIEEITIPDSVESIPHGLFYHCENLKKCTLGSGIKNISNQVFEHCTQLSEIRSYAKVAPQIVGYSQCFLDVKKGGTLYIPKGSDYSAWMANSYGMLGAAEWKVVEMQ